MPSARKNELGVGALLICALVLLAYMAVKIGAISNIGDQIQPIVILDDAGGITEGALVKVAGVEIGRVQRLDMINTQAVMTLSIAQSAMIRTDALVQVRARSVLGEKYVAIIPQSQTAPVLKSDEQLVHTRPRFEIDDLVNILGLLLQGVDPNAVSSAAQVFSDALQQDPDRAQRILNDVEMIVHNAAIASERFPTLTQESLDAITSLHALSDQTQPVIGDVHTVVAQLQQVSTQLPSTMAETNAAITDARALIEQTHRMTEDGQRLISEAEAHSADLEIILENLKEIDRWELRRLLREEGVLIRLRESEVSPSERSR